MSFCYLTEWMLLGDLPFLISRNKGYQKILVHASCVDYILHFKKFFFWSVGGGAGIALV